VAEALHHQRFISAAAFSIAAGAVHAAAAGAHGRVGLLGPLIGLTAVAQLTWGLFILVKPTYWGMLAGVAINGVALLAWATSRTIGLPLAGSAGEVQPVGVQDVVAAGLALAAIVLALGSISQRSVNSATFNATATTTVAVSLALIGILMPHDHGAANQSVPILEAGQLSTRLPQDEAIALLGLSARPPLSGAQGHSHDHGGGHGIGFQEPPPPKPLSATEQTSLDQQWAAAVAASQNLMTVEQATAAGYRQAGTEVPGVGSHWVKWSLVDKPFDPAQPSMLLFYEFTNGKPPQLAGFSYWVASAEVPKGFAGPNDSWHVHTGMCFIDGWLRFQNVVQRGECADTWIDGSDLWMLHAWPVPGLENRWGQFADMNPDMCMRRPNTPDILSCNPAGI
jgi:hypothetical protein